MRVTVLGHAGLSIETRAGTILCDPFFSPAFDRSWYPYPDNRPLRRSARKCDYLFVSHHHQDHLDPRFLASLPNKVPVLVATHTTGKVIPPLERLGFRNFVLLEQGQPIDLGGGTLATAVAGLPDYSGVDPIDTALAVSDRDSTILFQSDAVIESFRFLDELPATRLHFAPASGASWYPTSYEVPDKHMRELVTAKRQRLARRFETFASGSKAAVVVPYSGPPAFLTDELFHLNDLPGECPTVFPDQFAILEQVEPQTTDQAFEYALPGTAFHVGSSVTVDRRLELASAQALRDDKSSYLSQYRDSLTARSAQSSGPSAKLESWSGALSTWWAPALAAIPFDQRPSIRLALVSPGDACVVSFGTDEVTPASRAEALTADWVFSFWTDLIASAVRDRVDDLVDGLLLSLRFDVHLRAPYDERVLAFFSSIKAPQAGAPAVQRSRDNDFPECFVDGHPVPRYCPHLGADLGVFGQINGEPSPALLTVGRWICCHSCGVPTPPS